MLPRNLCPKEKNNKEVSDVLTLVNATMNQRHYITIKFAIERSKTHEDEKKHYSD